MQLISMAFLFYIIQSYRDTENKYEPRKLAEKPEVFIQPSKNKEVSNDPNFQFIIFQQAKLTAELKKVKDEIGYLEQKSRQAHSLELSQMPNLSKISIRVFLEIIIEFYFFV